MEWGLAVTDMALTLTAADGAEEEVGDGVVSDGGGRGMGQQSSAVLKEAAEVPVGPLSIDTSATTFFLPVGLEDTRAVSLASESRPPPLPEAEESGAAGPVVPLALLMMVGTLRWYLDTHSLSRRSMAAARRLSSAYLVSHASNSKL